jgi:hypothetical protein
MGYPESGGLALVAVEVEGRPLFAWYDADQQAQKVWLRVTKRRNCFEFFASKDGESFTPLHPMREEPCCRGPGERPASARKTGKPSKTG